MTQSAQTHDPLRLQSADRQSAAALNHTAWRVIKNTFAMGAGSNLNALGRLVVLAIIVRSAGMAVFAWYVILIEILKIAEWLVDFGTTEVFVREINRDPTRRERLLRVLTAVKLIQIPASVAVLVLILLALQYPRPVFNCGLLGALGLFCYAGVVLYRAIYRTNLTMEREVGADSISVVVLIALMAWCAGPDVALATLFGCYLLSRAVFSALCIVFGRRVYLPSLAGVTGGDVRWAVRSSVVIGLIGFLVFIYQTVEYLMLSKLSTELDMAFYSGAQKLVWPLLTLLGAVGTTMYTVVSAHWPDDRPRFNQACQRGVDATFLLGALVLSPLLAAPALFMGLLGPDLVDGSQAVRVLAVLYLAKAFSVTIGSTLYVVHAQRQVLYLMTVALLVKIPLIAILAREHGYMGVIYGALAVELLFLTLPSIYLVRRYTGFRVGWGVAIRVMLFLVIATASAQWIFPESGLWAAASAGTICLALVLVTGVVPLSDLRLLLTKKGDRRAGPFNS